jgi:hypothetical protein
MDITLFSKTQFRADVAAKAKRLQVLAVPELAPYVVGISSDNAAVLAAMEKDSMLHQLVKDAFKATYDELVDAIGGTLAEQDAKAAAALAKGDQAQIDGIVQTVTVMVGNAVKANVGGAAAVAERVMKQLPENRAAYRKFKTDMTIKMATDIKDMVKGILAVTTAGVAVGPVDLVSGATSPLDYLQNITASVKGLIGLLQHMNETFRSCESLQTDLDDSIKRVKQRCLKIRKDMPKGKLEELKQSTKSKEITLNIIHEFFGGTGPSAPMPSIKTAMEGIELLEAKRTGLLDHAHRCSKAVDQYLGLMETGKTEVYLALQNKLSKTPHKTESKALITKASETVKVASQRDATILNTLLKQTVEFSERYKKSGDALTLSKDKLSVLSEYRRSAKWQAFDEAIGGLPDGLFQLANPVDITDIVALAETGMAGRDVFRAIKAAWDI